tara:strand:+ start:2294 stop:3628 length:1335 start_codon:yes stop_codon:yes gene_type:complete
MPTIAELRPLLTEPREDLSAEYKGWLDLTTNNHRAIVAKAAIALANHGGGFIVLGMVEQGDALESVDRPEEIPEISQDAINNAVNRYSTPNFHCRVYMVAHPESGIVHPIVSVPGNLTEPVMSRRECAGVISQNKCYIRKPGPRSEEPQSAEEWRELLNRCVRAGRDEMLDSIRAIFSGRLDVGVATPDESEILDQFIVESRTRWEDVIEDLPVESPSRFPFGHYEFGCSLVGASAAPSLNELQERLAAARRPKHTGWPPFLDMTTPEWRPYPTDDGVEAWVGRPARDNWAERDPSLCDFWRATVDGKLYSIRGYAEDGWERVEPGRWIDLTMPVWRIGEILIFVSRLAASYEDVEAIAFSIRFTGLASRQMTSITGRRAMLEGWTSQTDEVHLRGRATVIQLTDNLPEFLRECLTPLYERFNFFRPPNQLYEEEIARLRANNF